MNTDADTIADLLPPRSRHVQFARPEPRRQDDAAAADEYTAFARGRVGTRPQMMICFRKCSGEVSVFAYSMLTRIYSENPDQGFTLCFHEIEVHIEGENLLQLFQYLREHRAVEIVEAERTVVMSSEGDCVVERVAVVSRK
jgi:hypothetical protein